MPLGLGEIIIIAGAFIVVVLFGRGFFKQMLKTIFGAKQDLEEVKKEFDIKSTKKV